MQYLKSLTKEQKLIVFLLFFIFLDFILLISSQATKEWYKGGDDGCDWKGNSDSVYSSDCYSHKSYSDTKCSDCDCCDSQVDLDKLGHSIFPFIVLLIFNTFWTVNLVLLLKKPFDLDGYYLKLSKILTIPAAFLAIIFFAVESFGITHEKVRAGLVLRVISIILFAFFTVVLCWLNGSLREKKNKSLFGSDVNPMSVLDSGKGKGDMLINREESISKY